MDRKVEGRLDLCTMWQQLQAEREKEGGTRSQGGRGGDK